MHNAIDWMENEFVLGNFEDCLEKSLEHLKEYMVSNYVMRGNEG